MKEFRGKFPSSKKEVIGNSDCQLNSSGKQIVDLVTDFVHAVRVDDEISGLIQRDTMYMAPVVEVNLDIVREINTTFGSGVSENYDALISHMSSGLDEGYSNEFFDLSGIRRGGPSHRAIAIKVNDILAGYYLPDINSWLLGNWSWHQHYVTIIMNHVFPQIISQLNLRPCENSITAGLTRKTSAKRLTVSLGADPEFEVTQNGQVVKADTALMINNYTSCDIGLDGAASQLEFRPKPGTPQQVVKNIRHLAKKFSEKYPEFDLTDAGNRYPLGGHIHVGVGQPIDAPRELTMMLDDFIGRPTIDLSGEARSSYKQLGQSRSQPHGFEYRSTPSAVFQNPRMTHITLTLMKNLCEKYFNSDPIKYNDRPTVQDYINLGGLSENQVKYFMDFCNGYKPQKSIRASWKVPAAPISDISVSRHIPAIEFRDDWNSDNQALITEAINESINTSLPITISLYGLHRDRGENRCTLPIEGCSSVERPLPRATMRNNVLSIGFSLDIRQRGLGSGRRRLLMREIARIISDLERSQ